MTPRLETLSRHQAPVWMEIRTDRLLSNLAELKRLAGPETFMLAVVKANAYGHGLKPVAKSLASHVNYFGVSSIHEAMALKEMELGVPILIFGRFFPEELPTLIMEGITLSVSSLDEARDISEISASMNRKTKVHIKVDTGMGRMGISLRESISAIEKMARLSPLDLEGIYTHFPTAEAKDDFALHQLAKFAGLVRELEKQGISFRFRHAQNSAGIVRLHEDFLNMARPGLMLYGIYPDASLHEDASVAPILSLKSRVNFVKTLHVGESAGYGRTFTADHATRIAILPIGYSHGYPWTASGKSFCLIQGRRYPIAGRVSMDYVAVNLGDDAVNAGTEVTLIGEMGSEKISAEDLAAWAGTIPYEIVTQLAPQIPRYYS